MELDSIVGLKIVYLLPDSPERHAVLILEDGRAVTVTSDGVLGLLAPEDLSIPAARIAEYQAATKRRRKRRGLVEPKVVEV